MLSFGESTYVWFGVLDFGASLPGGFPLEAMALLMLVRLRTSDILMC